jgi:hypothetical protein
MRKSPPYIGEDSERSLQGVVSLLNEGNPEHPLFAESRANLVRLIESWQEAQHSSSLKRFERIEREVGAPVPVLLKMKLPAGAPNLREIEKNLDVTLGPAGSGAYYTINYSPGRKWTAWDFAYQEFIRIVTNPERERFGGPCPRCQKYFVRQTAKPSIYCSRRCASQDTAIKRTNEVRREHHEQKLRVAREAITEWEKLLRQGRMRKPWKEWVAEYDRDAEITTKFLTRAVNQGELHAPSIPPERKAYETARQ